MVKTYIEIDLCDKNTNLFDKKIKEKLFSNNIYSNLVQLLNSMIINEFPYYNLVNNNKIILYSYDGRKQIYLSSGNYHYNSLDYSHSFLYFYDNKNNIPIEEIKVISYKLKSYLQRYLNYEINEPNIFVDSYKS